MAYEPKIAHIDVIVFPFFHDGIELESLSGQRKARRWIEEMRRAAQTKTTAFIVIDDRINRERKLHKTVDGLLHAFSDAVEKLRSEGLAYVGYDAGPMLNTSQALKIFAKKRFARNVLVRGYGQHAHNCVEEVSQGIARQLTKRFAKAKVGKVAWREVTAMSVKYPAEYAAGITGKIKPEEARIILGLAKRNRKRLFSLRSPTRVRKILKHPRIGLHP